MKAKIASCSCGNEQPTVWKSEDHSLYWVECSKCHVRGPLKSAGGGRDYHEKAVKKAVIAWNEHRSRISTTGKTRDIRCRTDWL